MTKQKTDILIIGMGLAGMTAAITAARSGKKITILTKTKSLTSGNTPQAQGGIVYKGRDDSPEKLKEDILNAGAGHCWEEAVEHLCKYGPGLVEDLLINTLNVPFNKNTKTNDLERVSEGAHSRPRVLYHADKTGNSIHKAALDYLQAQPNVQILTSHMAIDLLTFSHHSTATTDIYKKPACYGAMVLNNDTGQVISILASKTILASGGIGQLFLHTTNPNITDNHHYIQELCEKILVNTLLYDFEIEDVDE